ncbi:MULTISPECIES: DUF3581 family protein [Rheinheimera]|uniref:DUF3581 family protein n=1 Tax=Rheinheimera marina TaxID=1774958 RepID=A0ABV9JQY0_9GAMM
MFLQQFINLQGETVQFSREQACRFAKEVATDFNPIHDAYSKRFCVPGDLLFAHMVAQHGLAAQLECSFAGMVSADVPLRSVQQDDQWLLKDAADKNYLILRQQGELVHDAAYIEALVKDYVRFSGQNFPHILQPLMQQHQVMINPQRPLVIYERMSLQFDRFGPSAPSLQLADCQLQVEGKRGLAILGFELIADGQYIGRGEKRMILSNLQPYNHEVMQQMVDFYNARKLQFADRLPASAKGEALCGI